MIETLLIVIFTGGFALFLFNGYFAHPWTDDYIFSAVSRDKGFIDSLSFWYHNITGRYFSVSLMLVNPLVYGQIWAYKLLPFILSAALFGVLLFFLSEVTADGVISLRRKILFVLALICFYLDQMPDIRSGLYWMAGTLTYLVGSIALLLFLVVMLRIRRYGRESGVIVLCSAVALGLILPGTNEIILMVSAPIVVSFIIFDYQQKGRVNSQLLFVLVAVLVGSCFALLAPGNAMRLESYAGSRNTVQAMVQAAGATASSLAVWLGTPHVIALSLVVVMTTGSLPSLQALSRLIHPLASSLLLFLLLFACYFPPYWSMGMSPPDRAVNMIYLFFLVAWLINVSLITVRLSSAITTLPIKPLILLCSVYVLIVFSLGHSNFVVVAGDLFSGRSYRFDQELWQRYAKINESHLMICEVDMLRNTPQSLFFSDIYFVNKDWINQSYADYFNKKSVVLKKIRSVQ